MKHPSLKTASLILNAVLLLALLGRESQHALLRFQMEHEAPSWARYAGTMQAFADFGNGVRRFYRPTLADDERTGSSFTGQLDHDAEVWTWTYYQSIGDSSRLSAVAFTDGYNARMRNFMRDPASYTRNGAAATRASD